MVPTHVASSTRSTPRNFGAHTHTHTLRYRRCLPSFYQTGRDAGRRPTRRGKLGAAPAEKEEEEEEQQNQKKKGTTKRTVSAAAT